VKGGEGSNANFLPVLEEKETACTELAELEGYKKEFALAVPGKKGGMLPTRAKGVSRAGERNRGLALTRLTKNQEEKS